MHCFVNGTAFRQREWLFLQSNVAWPPPGLQVGTEENFDERSPDRTRKRGPMQPGAFRHLPAAIPPWSSTEKAARDKWRAHFNP